jgi:hypothetical protein
MATEVLTTLLNDLLAAAVSVVENPPERRFVAHGAWAHDCESVTVKVTDVRLTQMANVGCSAQIVTTLAACVLRCYPGPDPDGNPPTAATITTAAQQLADDIEDLTTGLLDLYGAGTLFSVADLDCSQVQWIGARPLGPEGLIAGWEVSLTVSS